MAIESTDLGGGHSAREFDVRTNTFMDDPSTVMAKPERKMRDRLARVSNMVRDKNPAGVMQALLGVGLLFFGWRIAAASRARRRAPWFARLIHRAY